MNIRNCIKNSIRNIFSKHSFSLRIITEIVFILVILETALIITVSIDNNFETGYYETLKYNAVEYSYYLTNDSLISEQNSTVIDILRQTESLSKPYYGCSVDILKKIGDDSHKYIRMDRTGIVLDGKEYKGSKEKLFEYSGSQMTIEFSIDISVENTTYFDKNAKELFEHEHPGEKLITEGKEAENNNEIMMSNYMLNYYGISNPNSVIGKNISLKIDDEVYISDAKFTGVINDNYFRSADTVIKNQIVLFVSENNIGKYTSGTEKMTYTAPVSDISVKAEVYDELESKNIVDKVSINRLFLIELGYIYNLKSVSRYILSYLCTIVIFSMLLKLYCVISDYVKEASSYYGMLYAMGMKRRSMMFSFVFSQIVLTTVSVIVSYPLYELFVIFINKFIAGILGEEIRLSLGDTVNIALVSAAICMFLVIVISVIVFYRILNKNIIDLLKK